MGLPRRTPRQSGLFATEQAPRLVLRFAVVLSITLGLAAALILVVVRHFAISEAERAATRHAGLVASTLLQREVTPGDLARRVSNDRRRELDGLFRAVLVADDVVGVSLVRRDGVITYSTDKRTIGSRVSRRFAVEAAAGTIVSRAARQTGHGLTQPETVLQTFAPVGPRKGKGAALVVQSYAPIHAAARSAAFRIGGVLQVLLLVLFLVFVPFLAQVTKRIKEQIDRIHFQAFYDGLTGLPNRAHLSERLEVALRLAATNERRLAALLVDLYRFREVNSAFGHETGDALLKMTAERLHAEVGSDRLLARLGGDEFAIVIEYEEEKEVKAFAEAIRKALEAPAVIDGLPLAVDTTIGIALFPNDGGDVETLLRHAEVAADTAKEWRVGVLAYSPAVDPHDPEQLELMGALRDAVGRGELRLHYQPQIDLRTGRVAGFEALSYWEHPTRGLLAPGAFIPSAERTGAIRHVTRAVLAGAVAQLEEWSVLGHELTVSVNLSAIDVLDPKLPRQLKALLRRHGVEPARLCIELTERAVMAAPDQTRSILERIVAAGIRVSIDDFGTGHSSLAHLKSLPVHEVKIDRSFVSDMGTSANDRTLVRAAIQLGHSLGLDVVAEGVETDDVHEALRALDCDQAQGYLYGRPLRAEEAAELLSGEREAA